MQSLWPNAVVCARGTFLGQVIHIHGVNRTGFLLGSGGAGAEGGALARFVPERGERLRLITEAAHSCAREAQTEEAIELFLYAGQPRPALHILNLQISELLEPALQEPSASACSAVSLSPACALLCLRHMPDEPL